MERRGVRILVWIALAVPVVMDAVYFSFVRSQDSHPPDVYTVPFIATYMLLTAGMLGVSQLTRVGPLLRATLRAGAAAGLIVLGVLAAFSIGLPILVAGILAAVAFGLSVEPARWQWTLVAGGATALIATAVLIGGLDVTQRIIVCPQTGQSGGGGTGLFTGQYQWSCDNGQLTWGPGG